MNDERNESEGQADETSAVDDAETIRQGSPFRGDPFDDPLIDGVEVADLSAELAVNGPPEVLDVGVMRSTAAGAAVASLIILAFASGAAWSFPAGGVVVSALGCAMAIFGMTSPLTKISVGCLILHAALFATCFVQVGSGS